MTNRELEKALCEIFRCKVALVEAEPGQVYIDFEASEGTPSAGHKDVSGPLNRARLEEHAATWLQAQKGAC